MTYARVYQCGMKLSSPASLWPAILTKAPIVTPGAMAGMMRATRGGVSMLTKMPSTFCRIAAPRVRRRAAIRPTLALESARRIKLDQLALAKPTRWPKSGCSLSPRLASADTIGTIHLNALIYLVELRAIEPRPLQCDCRGQMFSNRYSAFTLPIKQYELIAYR